MERRGGNVTTELVSFDFQYLDSVSLVFGVHKSVGRSGVVSVQQVLHLLLLSVTAHWVSLLGRRVLLQSSGALLVSKKTKMTSVNKHSKDNCSGTLLA